MQVKLSVFEIILVKERDQVLTKYQKRSQKKLINKILSKENLHKSYLYALSILQKILMLQMMH